MAEKLNLTDEQKIELAKTGRVQLGSRQFPVIPAVKNYRYVYNPHPYLVVISSLGVPVRPGELVDLVAITRNAEKVFSDMELQRAITVGYLIGFETLEEVSKEDLKVPDTTSPLEELKATAVAVGPSGTERVVEEITNKENPYTEALIKEYEKEAEEIERLEEEAKKTRRRKRK